MSLAAALAAKAEGLTKVEKVEEKRQHIVLCDGDESYSKLMRETYLEEYVKSIEQFTFKSTFCPLVSAEAQEVLTVGRPFTEGLADNVELSALSADELYDRAMLAVGSSDVLQNLAGKVDLALSSNGGGKAFIRLSSRSPKDAALRVKGFKELCDQEVADVRRSMLADGVDFSSVDGKKVGGINAQLWGLYRASTRSMCVETGTEAVTLLLLSDRIRDDLEGVARPSDGDPEFNVCIREWFDIDVKYELRGFFYKNQFTALTQYNEYVFFPGLEKEKEDIRVAVDEWMSKNHASIQLESFVLDIALRPRSTGGYDVFIVELNPFAEFAGGGLFSWTEDMDVLLGRKPFEFRSCQAPREFAEKDIPTSWARWLSDDS